MPYHQIVEEVEEPTYIGCYRDANSPRAMDGVGKYTPGGMTNEVRYYIPGFVEPWQWLVQTENALPILYE